MKDLVKKYTHVFLEGLHGDGFPVYLCITGISLNFTNDLGVVLHV